MDSLLSHEVPQYVQARKPEINQRHLTQFILVTASPSASEAFRALYEYYKSFPGPMSFGYLMRKLGISSKGYLSLLMAGSRPLSEKHILALVQIFKMDLKTELAFVQLWNSSQRRHPFDA